MAGTKPQPSVMNGPARPPASRSELIHLLTEAAELEHSLACQYLFTAFTLKQPGDEGLTAAQHQTVRRWTDTIVYTVAVQEMLHLTLACNLLSAIGAAPHLRRPPFPHAARFYSFGLPSALMPFSESTIARYLCWEKPAEPGWWDGFCAPPSQGDTAAPLHPQAGDPLYPEEPPFRSVTELYHRIEAGFEYLAAKGDLFIGPPEAQVTPDESVFPDRGRERLLQPIAIRSVPDARRAIELIILEGEGAPRYTDDCHFCLFARIRRELQQERERDPAFEPARPVIANPVFGFHREGLIPGAQRVTDPLTRRVGAVFSATYDLMLQLLMRVFAHTEETPAQVRTLVNAAVGLMGGAIQPLGIMLTGLPAGAEYPGMTAGPSFELYRDVQSLPHMGSAWRHFHERLQEIADQCAAIGDVPGAPLGLAGIADLVRSVDQFEPSQARAPLGHELSGVTRRRDLARFVGLSAVLTGYRTEDLAPPVDPDDVAAGYFQLVRQEVGDGLVDRLLAIHAAIEAEAGGEREVQERLVMERIQGDAALWSVATRIIRLWYLSTWYRDEPPRDEGRIVSATAYKKGLAWTAVGAHPRGYSELPYGHWAERPMPDEPPP